MAAIEFTAFARNTEGRGPSRRLRRSGRAPGIVYGGSTAPTPIELDHNALIHALRNEAFHSSILSMTLDGASTQVLIRDVQMHPFRHEVMHIDFQRIDPKKRIHMKVPLHFVNEDVSPAVKQQGALVSHVMTEIDIACLPADLPEYIEIDLSALDTAHSLHVSAVKMPSGVSPVVHGTADPVVATAVVPRAAAETEDTAAAEGAAAVAAPAGEAKPGDNKTAEKAVDKKDDKKK